MASEGFRARAAANTYGIDGGNVLMEYERRHVSKLFFLYMATASTTLLTANTTTISPDLAKLDSCSQTMFRWLGIDKGFFT